MADEIDVANDAVDKWLEGRIAEYQHQLSQAGNDWPYGFGRCKNCGDVTGEERTAFCGPDCRTDFDDRLRAEKRNGKYRGG